MATKVLIGGLVLVVGLSACSGTGSETAGSDGSSASTTTAPLNTTTTEAVVSSELQSLIAGVIVEWNSGDTERWRATFAAEAFTKLGADEYPIEILQDGHDFFAVLGEQLALIECVPATAEVGEGAVCEVESANRFTDHLGQSPVTASLSFEFVDGLIVHYRESFQGAGTARAAWVEFAAWIGESNPEDAEAMRTFPGDAHGAQVALRYMDQYFADG